VSINPSEEASLVTDSEKIENLAKQINNLEEKIDAIIKHFKVELPKTYTDNSIIPSTTGYKDFPE
jgi:hypothetical protein